MRQSKFTETQIVSMLKEADAGRPVNEIWRSYGISSATYYKWKAKYGGLEASDVKRLKELERDDVGPIPRQLLIRAAGFFDDLLCLTLPDELARRQVPE
jgi:putative transposase